jgi:hypothetical protein
VIVQVKDAIANPTTNTTTHEAAVRVAKAVCTGTGTLCFLVQVSRAMEAVGCRGVGIPAGDQRGRETATGIGALFVSAVRRPELGDRRGLPAVTSVASSGCIAFCAGNTRSYTFEIIFD